MIQSPNMGISFIVLFRKAMWGTGKWKTSGGWKAYKSKNMKEVCNLK